MSVKGDTGFCVGVTDMCALGVVQPDVLFQKHLTDQPIQALCFGLHQLAPAKPAPDRRRDAAADTALPEPTCASLPPKSLAWQHAPFAMCTAAMRILRATTKEVIGATPAACSQRASIVVLGISFYIRF